MIDWLQGLPDGWVATRLKFLTPPDRQIMYGIVLPGPNVADGIPIVKSGDCVPHKLRLERLHRTTPEIEAPYARSRLRSRDIVFAIRGSIGMSAIVPDELAGANLTQDAARIAPAKGIDSRWLLYAVQSRVVWTQLEPLVVGATVKGINIRDLKRPLVPVPPVIIQRRIADFLDKKTAALDALIAKKERLLELLAEKRQVAIDSAVRRLDGTPMKLGYFVDLLAGNAFSSEGFQRDIGVRLLRGVNVGVGSIRWDDTVYWDEQDATRYSRFNLAVGDIVMGMDRPWISEGLRVARITSADAPSLLLQRVARLRTRSPLCGDYLQLILLSTDFRDYFNPIMTGVSVPHLSGDQILGFRVVIPPAETQRSIISQLQTSDDSRITFEKLLLRQIAKLREYRQALITAAVTGTLDVMREVA